MSLLVKIEWLPRQNSNCRASRTSIMSNRPRLGFLCSFPTGVYRALSSDPKGLRGMVIPKEGTVPSDGSVLWGLMMLTLASLGVSGLHSYQVLVAWVVAVRGNTTVHMETFAASSAKTGFFKGLVRLWSILRHHYPTIMIF